jgi:hypothetical protein
MELLALDLTYPVRSSHKLCWWLLNWNLHMQLPYDSTEIMFLPQQMKESILSH